VAGRATDGHQEKQNMSIIAWIIVGIIAGWIAEKIMGRNDSLIMNLVIGVVGALVGGFLTSLLFGADATDGNILWSILVAVVGAVVLLAIINAVRGRTAR
jgi:uncharacterized membrane protein YeaQ/YmgE (transglycosylase-associated protein family)